MVMNGYDWSYLPKIGTNLVQQHPSPSTHYHQVKSPIILEVLIQSNLNLFQSPVLKLFRKPNRKFQGEVTHINHLTNPPTHQPITSTSPWKLHPHLPPPHLSAACGRRRTRRPAPWPRRRRRHRRLRRLRRSAGRCRSCGATKRLHSTSWRRSHDFVVTLWKV